MTPRDAWRRQKNSAIKRGVGWNFTFESWCKWWQDQLGPDWFSKRGTKTGQYVMARFGDKGPYSAENIRCATVAENHSEYNNHRKEPTRVRRPRLTEDQVIAVFKEHGQYSDIAKRHGVDPYQVHAVKVRMYYRKITDKLVKGTNQGGH